MVTAPPRPDPVTIVRKLRAFDWERFTLSTCAGFHGLLGFTLLAAPIEQVYNAGTAPVFALASRYVWAVLFLAAGLASGLLLHYRAPLHQFIAWLIVFPLGAVWLAAFTLAVLQGHGSALSIVVWVTLYAPWAVVAVRLGLRK